MGKFQFAEHHDTATVPNASSLEENLSHQGHASGTKCECETTENEQRAHY